MLVVGPPLAAAAEARASAEVIAAAHGVATLDVLATASEPTSIVVADVLRALVVACIIDPADVDDTVSALGDAGLVPSSVLLSREGGSNAQR